MVRVAGWTVRVLPTDKPYLHAQPAIVSILELSAARSHEIDTLSRDHTEDSGWVNCVCRFLFRIRGAIYPIFLGKEVILMRINQSVPQYIG